MNPGPNIVEESKKIIRKYISSQKLFNPSNIIEELNFKKEFSHLYKKPSMNDELIEIAVTKLNQI